MAINKCVGQKLAAEEIALGSVHLFEDQDDQQQHHQPHYPQHLHHSHHPANSSSLLANTTRPSLLLTTIAVGRDQLFEDQNVDHQPSQPPSPRPFTTLPTATRSHQTTDINKAGTLQMVISSPFSIGLEALTRSLRSLQHV